QRAVNVGLPHQLARVLRLHAASIKDAQLASERLAEDVRNLMPNDGMRIGCHLGSRRLSRADRPAGLVSDSELGRFLHRYLAKSLGALPAQDVVSISGLALC